MHRRKSQIVSSTWKILRSSAHVTCLVTSTERNYATSSDSPRLLSRVTKAVFYPNNVASSLIYNTMSVNTPVRRWCNLMKIVIIFITLSTLTIAIMAHIPSVQYYCHNVPYLYIDTTKTNITVVLEIQLLLDNRLILDHELILGIQLIRTY